MKKRLKLGVEVADMHYSLLPLTEHYDIINVSTWLAPDGVGPAFIRFIEQSVGNTSRNLPYRYTNKMLVIISDEPDVKDFWTAAWCYDGFRFGICKIKGKGKA